MMTSLQGLFKPAPKVCVAYSTRSCRPRKPSSIELLSSIVSPSATSVHNASVSCTHRRRHSHGHTHTQVQPQTQTFSHTHRHTLTHPHDGRPRLDARRFVRQSSASVHRFPLAHTQLGSLQAAVQASLPRPHTDDESCKTRAHYDAVSRTGGGSKREQRACDFLWWCCCCRHMRSLSYLHNHIMNTASSGTCAFQHW